MELIEIKWGERLTQGGSYRWKELSHLFTLFAHIEGLGSGIIN
jgi:hypothetical protein